MYTDSLETEIAFNCSLVRSHDIDMADNEIREVCSCPKCSVGTVLTRCKQGVEDGTRFWSFEHYCNNCHELFEIGRINSDIFFNKPYKIVDYIETPFGNIYVTVNDVPIQVRIRLDTYEDTEDESGKPVVMQIIDIDFSDLKQNDKVFCGFKDNNLEHNDSDERSVLYTCEDDNIILGLCAFDPDCLKHFCYELCDCTPKGFGYHIITDPKLFDVNKLYQSKICSLAVAWFNKADYKNPDTIAFLALTSVIG